MASILKKAQNYKVIPFAARMTPAHIDDPYTPAPQLFKPTTTKKNPSPKDVTDFPKQQTVPIPEAVPYREGRYDPPSIPVNGGYYPYNMYLEKEKVYWYCSCGTSFNSPFCDSNCNKLLTRNRPIYFNVNESGYYKLCTCRMSRDAPFCNGTHREVQKFYMKSHRGRYEVFGQVAFFGSWVYMLWNFYT